MALLLSTRCQRDSAAFRLRYVSFNVNSYRSVTEERDFILKMDAGENLILEVQKNPVLYDKSNAQYKDQRMKKDLWIQIGARLGLDGKCSFIHPFLSIRFLLLTVCMNKSATFKIIMWMYRMIF